MPDMVDYLDERRRILASGREGQDDYPDAGIFFEIVNLTGLLPDGLIILPLENGGREFNFDNPPKKPFFYIFPPGSTNFTDATPILYQVDGGHFIVDNSSSTNPDLRRAIFNYVKYDDVKERILDAAKLQAEQRVIVPIRNAAEARARRSGEIDRTGTRAVSVPDVQQRAEAEGATARAQAMIRAEKAYQKAIRTNAVPNSSNANLTEKNRDALIRIVPMPIDGGRKHKLKKKRPTKIMKKNKHKKNLKKRTMKKK